MLKKVVVGTLLVGLIGVLVAGAIIRTWEKTGLTAQAHGLGHSENAGEERGGAGQRAGQSTGGNGFGGQAAERQYPNHEDTSHDSVEYEGTVVQAPAAGVDMVIKTDDGQQLLIGTGPGYMEAQGFTLEVGERVRVEGYWEGDELKASQVLRLRDGEAITLRDQDGRPSWAGAGRRGGRGQSSTSSQTL